MPLLLTSQPVDVVYTINNSPNPNLFFWSRISQLFALEFGDLMALMATHLSLLPPDPPESCQLDPLAGRDLLLWLSGTERHPADHQAWWTFNLAPRSGEPGSQVDPSPCLVRCHPMVGRLPYLLPLACQDPPLCHPLQLLWKVGSSQGEVFLSLG